VQQMQQASDGSPRNIKLPCPFCKTLIVRHFWQQMCFHIALNIATGTPIGLTSGVLRH